jgi:predicted nuclease of predicted toxin-antitoxin system
MSFAVKLDENLGRPHVELLRQAGLDADRVSDQGLSGATDKIKWERCCAEARFFITLDLDFADVRQYPCCLSRYIVKYRHLHAGVFDRELT